MLQTLVFFLWSYLHYCKPYGSPCFPFFFYFIRFYFWQHKLLGYIHQYMDLCVALRQRSRCDSIQIQPYQNDFKKKFTVHDVHYIEQTHHYIYSYEQCFCTFKTFQQVNWCTYYNIYDHCIYISKIQFLDCVFIKNKLICLVVHIIQTMQSGALSHIRSINTKYMCYAH